MINTAVVGGSGYAGLQLLRILALHPQANLTAVTSRQEAGRKVVDVFPSLAGAAGGLDELVFEAPDPEALRAKADFFFTAVPHQTGMETAPALLADGGKVVDLSADYRFVDPEVYGQWYLPHLNPELLAEAVYGLPELHRDRIASARLVGNPGCYPTSVILAAAPLLRLGLVDPDSLIADSKSGVSGAGRGLNLTTQYCEINDGITAYKVVGHRHTPEMEQELGLLAGRDIRISFTPHLTPFSRGILSTVYASLTSTIDNEKLTGLVKEFYGRDPFVRVRPAGGQPHTLDVKGTNYCDLGYFVDERTNRVKAVSVIDNLTGARPARRSAVST